MSCGPGGLGVVGGLSCLWLFVHSGQVVELVVCALGFFFGVVEDGLFGGEVGEAGAGACAHAGEAFGGLDCQGAVEAVLFEVGPEDAVAV